MQERFYESGSCVQKNCAILGVHPTPGCPIEEPKANDVEQRHKTAWTMRRLDKCPMQGSADVCVSFSRVPALPTQSPFQPWSVGSNCDQTHPGPATALPIVSLQINAVIPILTPINRQDFPHLLSTASSPLLPPTSR